MGKLTLDASLPEKLRAAREPVEICDENGATVGTFSPNERAVQERVVAWLRTQVTSEELDRRAAEAGPGKSWEDLKKEMGIA